ncbi:hypothetical protein DFH08DRAFT_819330 [Mycena albidolilacea]|uniref:Uncharacterized protein n=1 Tax=Mycena albidolilacea TaxID=1033008 RepID=A0AAD6ZG33_9AGAR|nr:hypothetical protein DFH08DRAFT_819330 [Mycena albidolilacea]
MNSIESLVICGSISASNSPLASLPSFLAVLQLPSIKRVGFLNIHAVPNAFLSLALISARVVLIQNIGLTVEPSGPIHASVLNFFDSDFPQHLQHLHTLEVAIQDNLRNKMSQHCLRWGLVILRVKYKLLLSANTNHSVISRWKQLKGRNLNGPDKGEWAQEHDTDEGTQ